MKKIIGNIFCLLTALILLSTPVRAAFSSIKKDVHPKNSELKIYKKSDLNSLIIFESEEVEEFEEFDSKDNFDETFKFTPYLATNLIHPIYSTLEYYLIDLNKIVFSKVFLKITCKRWQKNAQFRL
jgi:hypothetical protein